MWKSFFERQDVACGQALVGARIMNAYPVDQAQFLEPGEVFVQRRDRHFRVVRQPRLCREAAESGLCRSQRNHSTILVAGFNPRCWMAQTVALWLMVPPSALGGRGW